MKLNQKEICSDNILVSDYFYSISKEKCTYEPSKCIFVRGQGSINTYKLIGVSETVEEDKQTQKISSPNLNDLVAVKGRKKKCNIL